MTDKPAELYSLPNTTDRKPLFTIADRFVPESRAVARRAAILAWAWGDLYRAHATPSTDNGHLVDLAAMFMDAIASDMAALDTAAQGARSMPRDHTPPNAGEELAADTDLLMPRIEGKIGREMRSARRGSARR